MNGPRKSPPRIESALSQGSSARSLTGLIAGIILAVFMARAADLWIAHVGCEQTWDDGAVQLARDIHYYSHGKALYADFRRPPYYAEEYGPAAPFVIKPLTRVFGSSVFACLRIGRWVTILGTFATCIVIALLAYQFSSFQAAALAALAFALTPVFFPWFSEFRVDMPALFLELTGLYVFGLGADVAALVILLGAFLTKETCVIAIVAMVGLSWYRGEYRRAIKLALGWTLLAVIATLLIQWRSPFYLLNTATSHVPLWDWSAPPELVGQILLAMSPLVVMAAAGIWQRARMMSLVLAYAIAAAVLCGLFALRWGSDLNYFLPLAAAIAIAAAAGIDLLLNASAAVARRSQAVIGVGLAAVLIFPVVVTKKLALRHLIHLDFRIPAESCETGWNPEAFRVLARIDGPILTALPDINLRINRRMWAPEFDVLRSMRLTGLFDDSELVEMVLQKKIAAIVLGPEGLNAEYRDRPLFWPRLRLAIEQNYVTAEDGGPPYVIVPMH